MITPQTEHDELAGEIGVPRLYFKREDLHPLGSHKGRSIPVMIDAKISDGFHEFVISSSGNAALAAVRYVQKLNAKAKRYFLTVFIGKNIKPEKREKLVSEVYDDHIIIQETERPLQSLFKAMTAGMQTRASLRQSKDPLAKAGYRALAAEIAPTSGLTDVFIGASSGTAAESLADYFLEKKMGVAVHIVQPVSNSPLAGDFDAEKRKREISIADAIVDKTVFRKSALREAIKKTRGSGWIVSNKEIKYAQRLLKEKAGIEATPNGALGWSGLLRALSKGADFKGSVVCIITGQ